MKFTLLARFLVLAACSTEPSPEGVSLGPWGGANVELEVSADRSIARFKCGALGTIDEPFVLDGAGRFDLSGTYDPKLVLGRPRPARYQGTVHNESMTLTLDVAGDAIGPYSLTQGAQGNFDVCNFQ